MKTFVAALVLLFAISVYKVYWAPLPDGGKAEQSTQAVASVERVEELKRLVATGDRMAEYELGLLYARGAASLTQDFVKAHELLRKAAMQGVPQAMYHLGEMYVRGDGVKENFEEATVWYWLGTSLGDKHSEKRLRAMNTRISAEVLADAKARVDKLWKEIPHDLKVERALH